MIRVRTARWSRISGGLLSPIPAPGHELRDRSSLWLHLVGENGQTGWGEVSPLPFYSRETLEDCQLCLTEFPWTALALDSDRHAVEMLAALGPLTDLALPAVRFGIETALLDLWAKTTQVSVTQLLQVPRTRIVEQSVLLGLTTLEGQERELQHHLAGGVRAFKRKLRGPSLLDQDLVLLDDFRRVGGSEIELRLDANQAFDPGQAEDMLRRVGAFHPNLVEEPVRGGELESLRSPVCLAWDESLRDPRWLDEHPVTRAEPGGPPFALILKPSALGGFVRCRELARAAARQGMPLAITHLFEGPIGMAACAAVALSLAGEASLLPCGLAPHAGLELWPPTPLPFAQGPTISPWIGPGLGLRGAWA